MAHGGKRAGAGRKRGAHNKASIARQKQVAASGITPLDYMLTVMRNPKADKSRRDEMAKAAAPYVHPKLASVQQSGGQLNRNVTIDADKLKDMTDDELEALERAIGKLQSGVGSGEGGEGA